ncbi:hypothetical protein HanRHA438_Chr08g0333391 [Helianthus annuus]|uniref:Uncharacterized protein n=1 Tax=Helianthus annuus TaxID=4232 RepID=A0A251U298_HELAN|nr:hypothetical protein HanXRQr2_Chr08g0322461 [Helianthus annuus]KAJ0537661.1 hypothetical protein HanHA300_Chr08g0266361 [Helianthus annuus]KAJ0545266.1 hypothetical protein HanIR_Chr08g0348031 [Helianthus annuus]KAJ0552244.1 hypothetical protein HanHA89_Chr08g0283161 [Helianthus annuus]KAJ0896314.1 hypothetical protein HanRHA438_Chr08g0333391 [Helianthus annuus]
MFPRMAPRVVGSLFLSVHPTILFLLLNPCYYNRTSCRLFINHPQTFHSPFSNLHSSIILRHSKYIQLYKPVE